MTNDDRARFTFRIPARTFELLKGRAAEVGVSVNALLCKILADWVEKEEKSDA